MMTSRGWDLVIGSGVVILALLGLLAIIPSGVVLPGGIDIAALSPDFWPQMVMIGMGLAGAIVLFQGLFPAAGATNSDSDNESLSFGIATLKLVTAILSVFVYYFAITYVGIVVSSCVVLLGLMMLGGERRYAILLPTAIILPVLLYYFFTYVANVPLPLGMFQS